MAARIEGGEPVTAPGIPPDFSNPTSLVTDDSIRPSNERRNRRDAVASQGTPADNDYMSRNIVTTSPDIMSGTPVFAGTRVPVQALMDCLEAGDSIDDFLDGFPTVSREQVIAFLEEAKNRMIVPST